ncbi:hypothetical protein [Bacillus sp. BP-3]|uniref:hypothetical protein n=1 Tax=Bacillus sp. BP-3 TaxID=3022773 RepID=UPI00232D05C1|nr:hypothetical protein [Bacillus sp. BP-3]MDC2867561.1 hypothetical protein [Bacillus sp. BP-3]
MTQFKFEFEKTYKEVDVAGELYKVEFNDEALTKYAKSFKTLEKDTKDVVESVKDIENATDEEIEELVLKQKEKTKYIVETFLGEGTFENLYEKAGRSSANLMGLINYLNEIYIDETNKKTDEARNKYLSNVKK